MGRVNRRIGKSSETANNTADGTGGGVLDAFIHDYLIDRGMFHRLLEQDQTLGTQRPVV